MLKFQFLIICMFSINSTLVLAKECFETTTGVTFCRDYTNPKLGESWRDPFGLVWGESMGGGGYDNAVNFYDAVEYCREKGGRLPSRDDFVILQKLFGGKEYQPQIFKHFTRSYWTSTDASEVFHNRYIFNADAGVFYRRLVTSENLAKVMCVMQVD
ncbi:hypothetical protein D3C72_1520240 [compost metagenome]